MAFQFHNLDTAVWLLTLVPLVGFVVMFRRLWRQFRHLWRKRRHQEFKVLLEQRDALALKISKMDWRHDEMFMAFCKRRERNEARRPAIQARWDARKERMRLERGTAQAAGPSRRQGRL